MSSLILYTIFNITSYAGAMETAKTLANLTAKTVVNLTAKTVVNLKRYHLPLVYNTTTNSYFINATTNGTDYEKQYWALSLLSIPAVTLFGNMLVITSVWRYHHLKSPINYFILGLAVADLLVAIAVMPLAVYVEINNGLWEFGPLVCDLFMAADVTCSTASIFLLTIISFDRYVAATQPIKYANSSKGVCQVTLINFVAWFVALCIASPMVLGLNNVQERDDTTCRFYNADFIIYSSTGSFCIPLILIIYLYARIYQVVKQRSKLARLRQAKTPALYHRYTEVDSPLLGEEKQDSPTVPNNSNHHASENGTVKSKKKIRELNSLSKTKKTGIGRTNNVLKPKNNMETGYPLSLQDLRKLTLGEIVHRKNYSLQNSCPKESTATAKQMCIANQNYHDMIPDESVLTPLPITRMTSTFFSFDDKFDLNKAEDLVISNNNPDCNADLVKVSTSADCCSVASHDKTEKTESLPLNGTGKVGFFNHKFLHRSPKSFRIKTYSMSARSVNSELSLSNIDSSHESNINEDKGTSTLESTSIDEKSSLSVQRKVGVVEESKHASPLRQMSFGRSAEKRRASRKFSKFARKEKKATKTLAIVLGVFLICWVPFFTLNFLNAVCIKFNWESCQVGMLPFTLTTWLGYMNSFMNPIIYTIFNMDFRRAFKELLCPCLSRKRIRRV